MIRRRIRVQLSLSMKMMLGRKVISWIARFSMTAILFLISIHANDARCENFPIKPDFIVSGRDLLIKTPSGNRQKISFDHEISLSDITLESLTFGEYADIKILDTEGASQRFYKVYLYRQYEGIYVYSKGLSDVPCLRIDGRKKELVGACFHESACENWTERYKVSNLGKLSIVERAGTYCDPAGQTYMYVDKFKSGKRISSVVKPIN